MELSPLFCSAVLNGVRKQGLSIPTICDLVGLPETKLRRILQEKAALEVRHIRSIERATGLTAGQLAVKSDPAAAEALGELMDELALAVPISRRAPKRTRKPVKTARA